MDVVAVRLQLQRSFAGSLWQWATVAALEFGYRVGR
jgi:sarcosine oxidase gamma subunit